MKKALSLYGVLLVLMTAGMVAITNRLLTLERQEQISALRSENERLALWRIESQLLPIVLRESSRVFSEEWLFNGTMADFPPEISCVFRSEEDETVAVSGAREQLTHDQLARDLNDRRFRDILSENSIRESLTKETSGIQTLGASEDEVLQTSQAAAMGMAQAPSPASQQVARSQNEFMSRSRNALQNSAQTLDPWQLGAFAGGARLVEPMRAVWVEDRLYLARATQAGKRQYVEGCRFDWDRLRTVLLTDIVDLLPSAQLVPLRGAKSDDYHAIANLPLRLIPGDPDLRQLAGTSTLLPTLSIAWAGFLASAFALGGLLVGTMRLSERRAAFASAVTHELRTPLTTFRLYCDLLIDRTRLSDEKHSLYISTLRNEAERLQHLIENVLSWSRLERSAEMELTETIEWSEFLDRIESSLRERVQQAGMTLHIDAATGQTFRFRANRTSVERVLLNLVDNACKYAKPARDKRIELGIDADQQFVSLRVIDHGPGIAMDMRSRLFRPFAKSASEAAKSAPGIGLGLSLSRRLARDMGGDLRLIETSPSGTTFEFRLPAMMSLDTQP